MALLTVALICAAGLAVGVQKSSAATDPCPNSAVRAQQGSERLPECRAFELVSPADKGGAFVALNQGISAVPSVDGERFLWTSIAPVPGTETPLSSAAVASREPTGWSSTLVTPAPVVPHPSAFTANFRPADGTDDLSAVIFGDPQAVTSNYDPADQNPSGTFLAPRDVYMRPVGGSMTLMSRGNDPTHTATGSSVYAGRSADGSHLLFNTPNRLLPIDAGRVRGDGVYDRTGGETVAVDLADDESLLSPCGASLGGVNTQQNAVSDDGSRIFLQSPARNAGAAAPCNVPAQLYLREDGDRTVNISRSRLAVPETTLPARFEGAAADGSIVYLTSVERLVEDAPVSATAKLYAYTTATDELALLADDVRRVVNVSLDGRVVAFTRRVAFEEQLLVAGDDGIKSVGSVGSFFEQRAVAQKSSFSPDGRYLAFVPQAGSGVGDAYRFDYETGTSVCVSCLTGGGSSGVRVDLAVGTVQSVAPRAMRPGDVTDDGAVFFTTPAPLVAGDANTVDDVYVFSDELLTDGGRALVTAGEPGEGRSRFVGVSRDGSAFFATDNSLSPADVDNGDVDIYVARVGGGFLAPSRPVTCDPLADACQGPGVGTGMPVSPLTTQPGGRNASPARPNVFSLAKLRRAQRQRAGRTGVLPMRIRVGKAGRLSLTARARIGKKTRRIARRTVRLRKAGSATVRLRLRPAARRALRRGRALKVRVTVTQRGVGTRSINVRLRRPQS